MNFLEYLNNKEKRNADHQILTEAFKDSELGKANQLIISLLKKQTNLNIVSLNKFDVEIEGMPYISESFLVYNKKDNSGINLVSVFTFNWRNTGRNSREIYSISFYDTLDVFINGSGKSKLTIETMGSSIVYFIPIISYILTTKDYSLSVADAKQMANKIFKSNNIKESELYIGALKHTIFEGLSDNLIMEAYNHKLGLNESDYEDMLIWKRQKQKEEAEAKAHKNDSPEANARFKELTAEYAEIRKAVKGGATSIAEVQLAVKKALQVKVQMPKSYEAAEQEIEKSKKDPDQVFKEMYKYIKMVAQGLVPSLIICGAPGVGKTWKTTNQLKAMGYEEDVNMYTIKGKCTPRRLYLHLYEYQDKGNIVLIDDADALVGPKAPEDCINILKAALDSTSSDEGRLVSYGIGGKLTDDDGNDIPKKFYYRGGVIILTNYNQGQLDTALRGRSYTQDIVFTSKQVLEIIHKLMPTIEPEKLTAKAKTKAYDYLMELYENGQQMELSIRTFGLCATMFQANMDDPEFTDEDTKSMIKEQMFNQSLRGGKKY